MFYEEEGNVPCHLRMADEDVLFGGADVDDVDPFGVGPSTSRTPPPPSHTAPGVVCFLSGTWWLDFEADVLLIWS